MSESLFERLGGTESITSLASGVVDNHCANPVISPRFADSDIPALKKAAAEFFITGTGGPEVYQGKDMVAAHKNMNISSAEFMAFLDDAMAALAKNNIGQREQEEVLFALFSMRHDVMTQ